MVACSPHFVPFVTTGLMAEIQRHGPAIVAQNRMYRANLLDWKGDHEEAQRLEREGDIALELVSKGV